IGTATGSFTDGAGHTGSDTAADGRGYNGAESRALTQGIWSNRMESWNPDGAADSHNWSNLVKPAGSGVLSALDINPNADGSILLGDTNRDGIANDAHDLRISYTAASALMAVPTSGDGHIIMIDQALAA